MSAHPRCPRCGYSLETQMGVPAGEAEPFTAEVVCPECALRIPPGAIVLEGGYSSRTSRAMVPPWVYFAGPFTMWLLLLAAPGISAAWTPRFGTLSPAWLAGWIVPMILGAIPACFFIGAFLRYAPAHSRGAASPAPAPLRLMVASGAASLWMGAPSSTAAPRVMPAQEIAAIQLDRPRIPIFAPVREERIGVSLVSTSDLLRQASRRRATSVRGAFEHRRPSLFGLRPWFVRTLWIPHPSGVEPIELVRRLDRTLRSGPDAGESHAPVPRAAWCPRCGARLNSDAAPGDCWQPLAGPVGCATCGVAFPAGAIVMTGSREGLAGPTSIVQVLRWGIALGIPLLCIIAGALIGRTGAFAAACALPLYLVPIFLFATGPIARVLEARDAASRGRFGPGDLAWSIEPGALHIVQRGTAAPQRTIPASAIHDLRATARLDPTGRIPQVRIVAVAAGSLQETDIIVPLPIDLDASAIESRLLLHLRSA